MPFGEERVGWWVFNPEAEKMQLDTQAIIQNTIDNMRRMEENVTLHVVIDFLRAQGYTVTEPAKEG